MEDMLGIAASAAGGGVFGLFGTALGRVVGFFERKQDIAHTERRWVHDADLLKLQHAAAETAADSEYKLQQSQASWSGLTASIEADAALASSFKWVNAVRGLTRPALTLLLWLISTLIWLGADEERRLEIAEAATFAATAATLWWFGDRGRSSQRTGS